MGLWFSDEFFEYLNMEEQFFPYFSIDSLRIRSTLQYSLISQSQARIFYLTDSIVLKVMQSKLEENKISEKINK